MSDLVVILRVVSLLAFAGPALLIVRGRDRAPDPDTVSQSAPEGADKRRGARTPVIANFAAFLLFFAALAAFAGTSDGDAALALALGGCALAIAGAVLALRSRTALGAAWSLVPTADRGAGLVTTGPYRLVRHPLYLGLSLLALGQAIAFMSWPAILIVALAIVPSFAWRARAEETLLTEMFGDRYARYRQQTRMMIPYLL